MKQNKIKQQLKKQIVANLTTLELKNVNAGDIQEQRTTCNIRCTGTFVANHHP